MVLVLLKRAWRTRDQWWHRDKRRRRPCALLKSAHAEAAAPTNPPAFAGFPTNKLLLSRTLSAVCVPPESGPLMNLVRRTKTRRHGGQQCAKSHCPVPCHSNTAQPLRECPGDNFAGHAASCVPAENGRHTWSLQKVPAEAGPLPERAEGAQSLQRPSRRVELSMSP